MYTMSPLTEAVLAGAEGEELAATPLPDTFRAAFLRREDQEIFRGVQDKDVRRTLHIGEVPMPEIAPDEVVVAVMAAAVNYNTVWSATFEPLPSFQFLKHVARGGGWDARHDQDFHIVGSDASGVVVRAGAAVRHWNVGDKVVITPGAIDEQEPAAQQDGLLADRTLAWGFETNY